MATPGWKGKTRKPPKGAGVNSRNAMDGFTPTNSMMPKGQRRKKVAAPRGR